MRAREKQEERQIVRKAKPEERQIIVCNKEGEVKMKVKKKLIVSVAVLILGCMLFSGCSSSEMVDDVLRRVVEGDTIVVKDGEDEYEIGIKKSGGSTASAQDGDNTGETPIPPSGTDTPAPQGGDNTGETPIPPSSTDTPAPSANGTRFSGYMIDIGVCGQPHQNRYSYLVSDVKGGVLGTLTKGTHTFYHVFFNPNSFPIKVAFSYQVKLTDSNGQAFWGDCGSYGEPNTMLAPGEAKVITTAFTVGAGNQVYAQGTKVSVSKLFTRISVSTANDTVPAAGTNVFVTDTKWADVAALGKGIASQTELSGITVPAGGYASTNNSLNPVFELPSISESDKKNYNGASFRTDGSTKYNYQSDSKHIAKYFVSDKGVLGLLGAKAGEVNTFTFVFKNTSNRTLEVFADFQGIVKDGGEDLWAGQLSEQTDQYKFYSVPAGAVAVLKIPVYVGAYGVTVLGQNVSVSDMFFRFDVRTVGGEPLPAGITFDASVANASYGINPKYNSMQYSDAVIGVR